MSNRNTAADTEGDFVAVDQTPNAITICNMDTKIESAGDRLRLARLAAGYRTAKEFADKHDIPQPTYQNHETGGRGIRLEAAQRYEKLLGNVDAAWILTGKGKSPKRFVNQSAAKSRAEDQKSRNPVDRPPPRAVRVIARVQAGVWRESPESPGDERYDVFVPIGQAYANLQVIGAEVIGNSMDLVYPEGTVLICVNTIELGDGWMPVQGDRVVARRVSREGLYETTVKEFVIDEKGQTWLVPRSSDPSLVAVPAELPESEDDEPIKIVGLVIGSYRPERRAPH